jgi:hypothetical protein
MKWTFINAWYRNIGHLLEPLLTDRNYFFALDLTCVKAVSLGEENHSYAKLCDVVTLTIIHNEI